MKKKDFRENKDLERFPWKLCVTLHVSHMTLMQVATWNFLNLWFE